MPTIDFHAHLAAGDPSREPPFLRAMFDPEGYLERQAAVSVDLTVLSNALMGDTEGDELAEARVQHDFLAGLVESHPDRFAALAGVNPWGGQQWLDEAERALDEGFAGLVLESGRDGQYLDSPEVGDFLALAEERDAVVFVHPSASPITDEQTGDKMLTLWIGRPYDTGISLARLLLSDTLSRYPNVKIVVAHGGGVVTTILGRLDRVAETRLRMAAFAAAGSAGGGPGPPGGGGGPPFGGPPGAGGPPTVAEGDRPSDRIRNLYLDTACYHPAGVLAAIASVGVDHVVFGSDHPPVDQTPQPSIDVVNQLELPDEDREKILGGNAARLLGR